MKKIIFAVMTVILLCSCGKTDFTGGISADSSRMAVNQASYLGAGISNKAYVSDSLRISESIEGSNDGASEGLMENKKIVKSARLDIEVIDAKETYAAILGWTKEHGGYEFSQTTSVSGGYNVVTANIKISPGHLDDLVNFIDEQSDVINRNVSAEDITDAYVDTDIRLKAMHASLDAYYNLLGTATSVEDVLSVQRTIDNITAEIESLQGRLNLWDRQVDESTLSINIREKADPVKFKKDIDWKSLSFSDMGVMIRYGFMSVWNTVVAIVQWAIIIVISILPILIICGAIILVIRLRRRKK